MVLLLSFVMDVSYKEGQEGFIWPELLQSPRHTQSLDLEVS
jgi:hypothetical protein